MNTASAPVANNRPPFQWQGTKIIPTLGVILLGSFIWFMPTPDGLTTQAWHLFAIFIATIVGLIAKPLPIGALAMIAVSLVALTGTLTLKESLSGFSSNIVWLVVSAFLLARGFFKTGLGSRIAYHLISILGKSTLGLAYGLTLTELILAPFMPSNTARGAGIIYPVIASLNSEYKSAPDDCTARKIGGYLIALLYQVNVVTSAMFLTATAGNPLVASLALERGITLSWITWAIACIVPGIINLICLPVAVYYFYPPDTKKTPDAPLFAKQKLKALGPVKVEEMFMIATFGILLTLWVFGHFIGVHATTAAIIGLAILLITGVLNWEDVIKEHNAWNTFIWMAVLIMLSSQLTKLGMMSWFGQGVEHIVENIHWVAGIILISALYYYSHYLFASMTAHITALFTALLMVASAIGVPVMMAVLLLAAISSLCAGITHYGTGSGPVFFASRFVPIKDWWRIGAQISVINFLIWLIFGSLWWKILGYW